MLIHPCTAPQVPTPAVYELPSGHSAQVLPTVKYVGFIMQRVCSQRYYYSAVCSRIVSMLTSSSADCRVSYAHAADPL
eukprot:360734-Chlamydomonas_euryale.AAC.4